MKELRTFADNFRAVFGPGDIVAMIFTTVGLYVAMILTCAILG